MTKIMLPVPALLALCASSVAGFALQNHRHPLLTVRAVGTTRAAMPAPSATSAASASHLFDPSERDARYGPNVARYLLDLHDAKATFDFCGGMLFQLVLSDKLRDHLSGVAGEEGKGQPVIFDASKRRMFQIPEYGESADADNIQVFHGREIRKVPNAAGGMGMVLQLSLADGDDPEGWTKQEVQGYDGWGHDSGRIWRQGEMLEREGFENFRKDFGKDAFALHHRFYLHLDGGNRMWLSAEDGCEGTPSATRPLLSRLANLLG